MRPSTRCWTRPFSTFGGGDARRRTAAAGRRSPIAGDEREPEHQDDRALAELDAVLLGLDVGAADEPARADDERLVQDDEAADERPLRPARAVEARVEALGGVDDVAVRMAQGDGDRVAAAHQDALDQGLAAVGEAWAWAAV